MWIINRRLAHRQMGMVLQVTDALGLKGNLPTMRVYLVYRDIFKRHVASVVQITSIEDWKKGKPSA